MDSGGGGHPSTDSETRTFRHPRREHLKFLIWTLVALLALTLLASTLESRLEAAQWPLQSRGQVFALFTVMLLIPLFLVVLCWLGYRGISGWAHYLLVSYRTDNDGLCKRTGTAAKQLPWHCLSSFSETEPTHRDGDRFCRLKSPDGETLMRVGAHVLGSEGPSLLAEIRRRLGPPRLPEGGESEVFPFCDFGDVPPYHVELTSCDIAAVSSAGELRLSFAEIESIQIRAWPEIGAGMERARVIGNDKLMELDSRLVGFWPLMDCLTAHAPNAAADDQSRRARAARPQPPVPPRRRACAKDGSENSP